MILDQAEGIRELEGMLHEAVVHLSPEHASLDRDKPLALLAKSEVDRVAKAVDGDKQSNFA